MSESSSVTELRLQAECFQWHWNTYPKERKRLFMIHNTPSSKINGNRMKAAGMVAGVADMEYLRIDKPPLFIEMKTVDGSQTISQEAWQKVAEATGAEYVICTSFEQFIELIKMNQ